jgi:hypothetical protein
MLRGSEGIVDAGKDGGSLAAVPDVHVADDGRLCYCSKADAADGVQIADWRGGEGVEDARWRPATSGPV